MSLLALSLVAQLAAAARPSPPVLAFPEAGLDDSSAYAGYVTRFHRDVDGNTVQLYLDRRQGRIVQLLANGENESVGFSARSANGTPAPVRWHSTDARVWREGRRRLFQYDLEVPESEVHVGRFVLGSMRVERDVQYFKEHLKPFTDSAYALAEYPALAAALDAQPVPVRRAALAALRASSLAQLRARFLPRLARRTPGDSVVLIEQLALDGLDTLRLRLSALDGGRIVASDARVVTLQAAHGHPLRFRVTISTTGRALTPLTRQEIFTEDFLAWTRDLQTRGDATRARWIERQVTGVELLASREKLMAGLPTYATYFGRDMLLSALMMQPIWRPEMSEFVIAAALRKLSPTGEVSHEEALGGQAIREAAADATHLLRAADSAAVAPGGRSRAEALRARAVRVLQARRMTRENYHMVDDEYQLPLLAARYLADRRVSAARKRTWLTGREGAQTRLALLLAELAVLADRSAPYVAHPVTAHFVPFAPRAATATAYEGAPRWFAQSWRDSGAGYGNGKYAMDVNAVYIPHALAATQQILQALRDLGFLSPATWSAVPALRADTPLGRYARDAATLSNAIRIWRGAIEAFVVRRTPAEVQQQVEARLAVMPADERRYWRAFPRTGEGIEFLALALNDRGEPIGVVNSDPATRLFLDGLMAPAADSPVNRATLRRDASLFAREYPEGLLVPAVGAVVANDAYATPPIWQAFLDDPYHGPRVVWGREVNLFLLGVASHLPLVRDDRTTTELLHTAATRVREAVAASGFRSELWSYAFPNGRPHPTRYGSGGDVQLWSTTDLAVQYVWARMPQ